MEYDVTIGLEVHCELKSTTKVFSPSPNTYSEKPNTNISVIDLAFPGILPVVNKGVIEKALTVATALNCETPEYMIFDRKNYYYPDLPKGYQITQMHYPVGTNGYLDIYVEDKVKRIYIHDTHLEEDTASLDHYDKYSLIDYNRCGVPLLETVTEPCMHSIDEALSFLESLKRLFLYTNVSDAKTELGQIRCDVNVSLAPKGSNKLGVKVEMKNINSFYNVKMALESEIKRQTELLNNGMKIEMETRRYDESTMQTVRMRSKEDAIDYKYFIEPNIPPIKLTDELKSEVRWFQKYKRDSIIYNIECIRPKDSLIGENIEEDITRLIQANNGVIWGYNSEISDVLSWYSGLLRFELSKSNYTADGNWYFWVDDTQKVDKLLNCPYKHSLNDSSNANKRHNKYLTEKTCKHCTYKLFDTWNGTYGLLVCNHSKVSNSDILKLLYRLNNF